ncbi:M23 family metallopeptidase [Myxococcota bacterium]|nr:M23 family metallopeptidase [Myxococcota bacterium]
MIARVVGVAAVLAVGVLVWVRAEGKPPEIDPPEAALMGAAGGLLEFGVADADSGLRAIQVTLVHDGGEIVVLERTYPGNPFLGGDRNGAEPIELKIDPAALGMRDGSGTLKLRATDWSWFENATETTTPITLDTKPPRIHVATGLTYIKRGGAGAVRYQLSEDTRRDGVQVGDPAQPGSAFFPGYPIGEAGERVAIFAFPTDAPTQPSMRVVAEDSAGNRSDARWPVRTKERTLPQGQVTLPGRFLDETVTDLARAEGLPTNDLVATFHRINTEVRAQNENRVREATANGSPIALFDGAFLQMRNSKVTSRFAEKRNYFVDAKPVSQATHFGYDLAATSAAPIDAANAGRVVYAGDLGIYGQCVIVDHGLGVASLYGHLSRLDVQVGDEVDKGSTLGLSGATGLAGGDHLHFAVLVGPSYVDPIEWWDPKWMSSHITDRLGPPNS